MEDLHGGFFVLVEVEAFGEDEDGGRSFFWRQSVGHTFLSTRGVKWVKAQGEA